MPFRLANIDERAALVEGDEYFDLERISGGRLDHDPMRAIAAFEDLAGIELAGARPTGTVSGVELGPVVPSPKNCFGIGLNYSSHVAEASMEEPEYPVVFTKFPSCISAPEVDVVLGGEAIDYEAELVVVIGRGGFAIAANDAWDHVAGVTGGQDISDRLLQFAANPPHFDLAKSGDTYGPIGPLLVSVDSFEDPDNIGLECSVNGELRQSARTDQLIFDVPYLIEYLSSILTLSPGDVIFTGTPEGVGAATGNFLEPGDVIHTSVEGIGSFSNRCVAPAPR